MLRQIDTARPVVPTRRSHGASLRGRRAARSWLVAAALALLGGCRAVETATPPPLIIGADRYAVAFDAAVEAVREEGMPATFRDRRQGIIETSPRHAASLLEPWRGRGQSLGQIVESTVNHQRRRARFEFTEQGFDPTGARYDDQLSGPDLLASRREPVDLTEARGPLELRVWVYLEREYDPGERRSTWTRKKTTDAVIVPGPGDSDIDSRPFWTIVSRDLAFEHRLLEAVKNAMSDQR